MFNPHKMSHVTCHVSHVTCHVSCVKSYKSHKEEKNESINYNIFLLRKMKKNYQVVELLDGGSVINWTAPLQNLACPIVYYWQGINCKNVSF